MADCCRHHTSCHVLSKSWGAYSLESRVGALITLLVLYLICGVVREPTTQWDRIFLFCTETSGLLDVLHWQQDVSNVAVFVAMLGCLFPL